MKGKPVAQKVQVLLVDDLDGGEADETVTFALDGVTYEIDLTTANADKLRGLLNPYTDSGRRTGGRVGRGRTKAVRGGSASGPYAARPSKRLLTSASLAVSCIIPGSMYSGSPPAFT